MSNGPHLHNGESYPEYFPPSDSFLATSLQEFRFLFEKFCYTFGFEEDKFSIDEDKLIRVFIRVDQRKLHYKMYHNGIWINELKETAVLCYWINQYKPITYNNEKCYAVGKFNELFAVFLVACIISQYRATKYISGKTLSEKIVTDLLYTLTNRINSYDSLTILIEALAL